MLHVFSLLKVIIEQIIWSALYIRKHSPIKGERTRLHSHIRKQANIIRIKKHFTLNHQIFTVFCTCVPLVSYAKVLSYYHTCTLSTAPRISPSTHQHSLTHLGLLSCERAKQHRPLTTENPSQSKSLMRKSSFSTSYFLIPYCLRIMLLIKK